MKITIIIVVLVAVLSAVLYLQNKSSAPVLISPALTSPTVTQTPSGTSSPACDFASPPAGCHYENISQTPCHADLVCSTTINISNFSFVPSDLRIQLGTKVIWQNNDNAPHNIIASNGSFHSSNLSKGDKFEFTFTQPGQYDYACGIHPSMRGKVIVQ